MVEWKVVLRQRLEARGVDHTRHFTVIEELAQHLDDRYQSLLAQGLSAADAEHSVRQELDEDEALERELRRAERTSRVDVPVLGNQPRPGAIEGWWQDVRYAARALRKSLGFSAVAVVALALGVGANTAIFSIVNAVMLRPLPYPHADRLVRVWESNIERGWPTFATSQPNFLDFRAQATTFEALAATGGRTFTLASAEGADIVRGAAVTVDFLPALGQLPVLGRNFLADEDRPGGDGRVVILSDGFWKRRFASDPAIVGRSIQLSSANYVVVGVLPPQFEWGTAEILVPLAPDPKESRGDHQLTAIGRLKNGVTIERAHDDLAAIASQLGDQYPESNKGWSVRLASFYDWLIPEPTRESLVILLGAVGGLLFIACANVASLLLARGAARQKELAIRIALGARRWRIVRQLLTESLLLALVACLAGLAVAAGATRVLVAYGPESVPRLDEASLDLNVILFALGISLLTVLVFGLIPAIQVSRQPPAATLQDAARGSTTDPIRQRLRSGLTVVEVAVSVALLIGAGLLLRSFWQLQQVDPGFRLSPLMTARITMPASTYADRDVRKTFYDRLLSEMQALPGVVGATTSSGMPFTTGSTSTELQVPGSAVPGTTPSASWRLVSPGFFATMGIPLRGRDFSDDREEALRTTIISEAMAREFWPNEDPIGRTVFLSSLGNRERTIIGVAGDVRTFGLDTEPPRMVYFSTTQFSLTSTYLAWRSAGDPASHVAAIRDVLRRLDPSVALHETRSFNELLSQSFGPRRFNMYLLSVFAAVALLLAAIGLFGVMAYLVSQRTREIGVRLALGADRRDIFRLIVGKGVVLAVSGALIGVGGAFWLTRVMQSLLFSVSATDPSTFVAVPVLLVLVALIACYIPARRAVRVDPVSALRAE